MTSPVLVRVLLSVLAGVLCGVVVTVPVLDGPAGSAGPGDVLLARPTQRWPGVAVADRGGARDVLRAWDADRASAWSTGDARALTRLYTAGSVAGRRDVAMLRAWTARGVRVTALTTQVLRLQVLVERRHRLVLVVTDRVAQVSAGPVVLPSDRPSTRRIVLVCGGSSDGAGRRWRVASVSPERPAQS